MDTDMLDERELSRYNRQIIIPDFGEEGQKRLKASSVVVAGVGGLGCASATYLAAAGVGHIKLVDGDRVDISNLNRQILYWEEDIGKEKVAVARDRLSRFNPGLNITAVSARITGKNALDIIDGADVVVDGLDNMDSRLVVNSACVKKNIPYIYGGVSRLRGMVTTIIPGETPCLACLYPEGKRGLGVLGVAPALIANIQALEAIKILIGHPPSLAGRVLLFNGDDMKFRTYDVRRNEKCAVCSSIKNNSH